MGVARKGAWMVTGGQRAVGCHTHSQWAGSKVAAGLPQLGGQTAVPADLIPTKNGSQNNQSRIYVPIKKWCPYRIPVSFVKLS